MRPVLLRLPPRDDPDKGLDPALLAGAPPQFKSADAKGKELSGLKFTVQVRPRTARGAAPASTSARPQEGRLGRKMPDFKAINMFLSEPICDQEAESYAFFGAPPPSISRYNVAT